MRCYPERPGLAVTCCDLYGNAGGDWVNCVEDLYGVDGNISADPLFCDPGSGDFQLQQGSPCAPGSDCDLIGAWPVGCGGPAGVPDVPAAQDGTGEQTRWGAIKAMFRE